MNIKEVRGYKIKIVGDVVTGRNFIGFAKKQFNILENNLRISGNQQGARTYKDKSTGIVIECYKCFDIKNIQITVPVEYEISVEQKYLKECLCGKCWALVHIIEGAENQPIFIDRTKYIYAYEYCKSDEYVIVGTRRLKALWAERFFTGHYCIAFSPAYKTDCCEKENSTCYTEEFSIDEYKWAILPIIVPGKMKQWMKKLSS